MKKVYLAAVITCIAILAVVYVPNVQAGKSVEKKKDTKNKYNIVYDETGNTRVLDEDNQQLAFRSKKAKEKGGKIITEDGAKANIKKFAREVITVSDYELEDFHFDSEQKYFTASYYKYKNGFKTQEFCFIDLDLEGNVISYAAMNEGTFDKVDLSGVKQGDIEAYIAQEVTAVWGSDVQGWEIEDMIAVLDEEMQKPQMQISVIVTFTDGTMCGEAFYMDI